MTRNESDKEDLIKDATAMVDRVEFSMVVEGESRIVTAGFRKDNLLSLYFEQDPFYQFDAKGLLRRAYEDGNLFRSQQTTLARMNRTRNSQQTTLNRIDLNAEELQNFQRRMKSHLHNFCQQLQSGSAKRLRAVTDDPNFDARLVSAIAIILNIEASFVSAPINKRKRKH